MRRASSILVLLSMLVSARAEADRQVYSYDSSVSLSTLFSAVSSNFVGGVGRIDTAGSQQIYIDFFDGATSTEKTSVQTTATGAPYNLTLQSTDTTKFAQPWMPIDETGIELWVTPHIAHCSQEATTGPARTACAVGSPVGQIDDSSTSAHQLQVSTTGGRPRLTTTGSPEMHLTFSSTSSTRLVVQNSIQGAFNFLNTTGIGTIAFWVRSNADGSNQAIADNNGGTTANSGLFLWKTSTNHIQVAIGKASAGNWVYNYTTTATLLASDGWQWVTITFTPGTNTSNISIQPKNISENFTNSTAVGGGNAAANLTIGCLNGVTSCGNFDFRDFIIGRTVLTSTMLTRLRNKSAPRSTTTQTLLRASPYCFTNFVAECYRFDVLSTLWKGVSSTTAVALDGDPIGRVDHWPDSTGNIGAVNHLHRWAQTPANVNRPRWRDGTGASLMKAAEFTGQDTNTTSLTLQGTIPTGGPSTWVIVLTNRTTNSAETAIGNSAHVTMSGSGNSGNSVANGGPGCGSGTGGYFGVHASDTNGICRSCEYSQTGYDVFELYRAIDSTYTCRSTQQSTNASCTTCTNPPASTAGTNFANIGTAGGGAGTALNGYVSLYVRWTTNLTTTQMDAFVYPRLYPMYSAVTHP